MTSWSPNIKTIWVTKSSVLSLVPVTLGDKWWFLARSYRWRIMMPREVRQLPTAHANKSRRRWCWGARTDPPPGPRPYPPASGSACCWGLSASPCPGTGLSSKELPKVGPLLWGGPRPKAGWCWVLRHRLFVPLKDSSERPSQLQNSLCVSWGPVAAAPQFFHF